VSIEIHWPKKVCFIAKEIQQLHYPAWAASREATQNQSYKQTRLHENIAFDKAGTLPREVIGSNPQHR